MDTGNPVRTVTALAAIASLVCACDSMERASVELTPSVVRSNEWGVRDPQMTGARDVFESWARDQGYRCHADARAIHGRICRAARAPHLRLRPRISGEGYVAILSWAHTDGRTREEFRRHVESFAKAFEGHQPPIAVAVRYDVVAPR